MKTTNLFASPCRLPTRGSPSSVCMGIRMARKKHGMNELYWRSSAGVERSQGKWGAQAHGCREVLRRCMPICSMRMEQIEMAAGERCGMRLQRPGRIARS